MREGEAAGFAQEPNIRSDVRTDTDFAAGDASSPKARKPKKERLDDLLIAQGAFTSREGVLRAVVAREVRVDDVYVSSAAVKVFPDADIFLNNRKRYVSRGGRKLQGALDAFDLIVIDVSFIGLAALAGTFPPLCRAGFGSGSAEGAFPTVFIGLVKPQFESRHDETDHGVVRDEAVRLRTVEEVSAALEEVGFAVTGVVESPITGPEGNVEYLVRAEFRG